MVEKNIKLSIIIPYYETKELTWMLLSKLLYHLRDGVEVILIDDGCNETSFDELKLNGFRIIHKENEGVAKSRNLGIKLAQGEYVTFIDCDDLVSDDYIAVICDAIDKYHTDIINFDWYDIITKDRIRRPSNPAPWKAAYRKEVMPIFREDMLYGSEDVPFQEEIQRKINSHEYSIKYLDKVLYFYNSHREGSLIWKKKHDLGLKH